MFNMEIKTIIPLNTIKIDNCGIGDYDDELDDGRSVIMDICKIMGNTEQILFCVSGFGDDKWTVDCRFDLPIIIEQLPEIIRRINNKDFNFKLDFYEQGIEREIVFVNDVECVRLVCISRTNWIPKPNNIKMRKEEVSLIFNNLYKNFLSYSSVLCNGLANHYLFKEWMKI
ncbi:hypothetical protein [Anaeromicropila populeti]|uniref:Uncharacterized protein n=1 Tax=Anaeromicropila populeti TaxID=37658 RepID=A0A1I6ITG2_9FIRM|nr:hypothetical protein [Anaeromicropila populeti]SFR69520.1 hypothetical protein SAMN05661086_01108 [Anaeromicropila populeti]